MNRITNQTRLQNLFMVNSFLLRIFCCVILLAGSLTFFTGCASDVGRSDARERDDPLLRRAIRHEQAGDFDAAIKAYSEALRMNPELARAHLDLALLLHDHQREYVGAVYHYRQYLEMRPDSQKINMIRERIRLALQLFAATISGPDRSAAAGIPEVAAMREEMLKLEEENTMLKNRINFLLQRIRLLEDETTNAVVGEDRSTVQPATSDAALLQTRYRVKPGDSLRSIALEFYGEANRATDILELNRETIRDKNRLLVGQELVLP